ncbi:transmembrane protein, putative (macronuclear) [Tetrahymena thermophila SB210]|uniref:Transmembrane protein, putative n=1 Tax=Tetrahymena thermophila (strain SB210) TaxID=312017 RepID=W7XF23_TETTS|nr:transmembrane protein, putative [Tetrahymena thermophila SB210]EWS75378.1 transmembrane protein, putative [Tetrahymena thermophila SB210]|eukprot:XP_012652052.1 transmembrane protein, putative [Tetrahymena thermophila SB210]
MNFISQFFVFLMLFTLLNGEKEMGDLDSRRDNNNNLYQGKLRLSSNQFQKQEVGKYQRKLQDCKQDYLRRFCKILERYQITKNLTNKCFTSNIDCLIPLQISCSISQSNNQKNQMNKYIKQGMQNEKLKRQLQQYQMNSQSLFNNRQLFNNIIDVISIINISFIVIFSIFTNYGSIIGWIFIQNQQIIGNYIFTPNLILVQMNQFELKSSYAHHIFTIIPNKFQFLSSDNQVLLEFNHYNTILKIDDFWSSLLINCFLSFILLGISILLLFIFSLFYKTKDLDLTLSLLQKIYNFIKWNIFVYLLRIIGCFLMFDSVFVLYQKNNTSITDYIFSVIFMIFYIALLTYWSYIIGYQYEKIKFEDIAQYQTLVQQIDVSNRISRIFWILFEWKKLIISIFQAFFVLDQNKSQITCWIHVGINTIFLIYLIWKRPFLYNLVNIMIISLETINIALIIFLGIITKENNLQTAQLPSNYLTQTMHDCYRYTMIGFISLSIIFQTFYIIQKIVNSLKKNQQTAQGQKKQELCLTVQETNEEKQDQIYEFLYQYNFQSRNYWQKRVQTDKKLRFNQDWNIY